MVPQIHSVWSMCSVYMTVGLAIERFSAISTPTRYRSSILLHKNPTRSLLKYFVPIVSASVVFHLPSFFQTTRIGGKKSRQPKVF